MASDSERWDKIHKNVPQDLTKHSLYAEYCEKSFHRDSTICDLAGGLGYDALYFIEKGHNVILMDISDYALNYAMKMADKNKVSKKLIVKKVDLSDCKLPLKDKNIDVVFSRIGFNYFPYKETRCLLAEAYRILKIGGKGYIAFKSPDDEDDINFLKKNAVEMEKNVFIEGEQIRSRFTAKQLENMMEEIGISDYYVSTYKEEAQDPGEALIKPSRKPLYLNEVRFKKI